MQQSVPQRILISRTDAIGDVVLTLPLATMLRRALPQAHIGFLGRAYTLPVIACCSSVDEAVEMEQFLSAKNRLLRQSWDTIVHVFPKKEIAWKAARAGIAVRVGTSRRAYHWATCNRLVALSRRHSPLHEAQLNAVLLAPLGISAVPSTEALAQMFAMSNLPPLTAAAASLLRPGRRHIIFHPKSAGSAREWGLDHYAALAQLLPKDRFQIFISGTAADGAALRPLPAGLCTEGVTDITGKFSLTEFIAFIAQCDGLVAASTGPLHIAAALGKAAIGLYPPIRPMHSGRWGPLGARAVALSLPRECGLCSNDARACTCMRGITPEEVATALMTQLE